MESCTKQCQLGTGHLFGNPKNPLIKVIDTPGFMDSSGSDGDTLVGIMALLEQIKEEGFHLGLFCFPATQNRCDKGI